LAFAWVLLAMIAGLGAAIYARHSADMIGFSDKRNALSMLWGDKNL
jgi:hypothetical protein